jgi:8-oxo-dGTP pyrophosphatase MutT (NUDIX family)
MRRSCPAFMKGKKNTSPDAYLCLKLAHLRARDVAGFSAAGIIYYRRRKLRRGTFAIDVLMVRERRRISASDADTHVVLTLPCGKRALVDEQPHECAVRELFEETEGQLPLSALHSLTAQRACKCDAILYANACVFFVYEWPRQDGLRTANAMQHRASQLLQQVSTPKSTPSPVGLGVEWTPIDRLVGNDKTHNCDAKKDGMVYPFARTILTTLISESKRANYDLWSEKSAATKRASRSTASAAAAAAVVQSTRAASVSNESDPDPSTSKNARRRKRQRLNKCAETARLHG